TRELAAAFRGTIERGGLGLEIECASPIEVHVDREMWEKIVLNLISNAFKHTFSGHIRVGLRVEGQRAILEVSDTRAGVPSAELPRLFERFHRVAAVRSRADEGAGMGLALVHELVKLHGGTVTVASEPNSGTSFRVTMPLGVEHLPSGRVGAP